MNTPIIGLQFALFYKDYIERPDLAFEDLNISLMNIFDGMPTSIPVPKELPSDVPIKTLRSENNEYICNISRSRIDFLVQRIDSDKDNNEILRDFNIKIAQFIKYVVEKTKIVRFGLICRYFHESDKASELIKTKYFKGIIGNAVELSLRFNQQKQLEDWTINDLVDISAVEMFLDNTIKKGIFIQRDINNTPIDNKYLTDNFLKKVSKEYASSLDEQAVIGLIK